MILSPVNSWIQIPPRVAPVTVQTRFGNVRAMTEPTPVLERIAQSVPEFTASELRVAEAVLDDPKLVAFGTVAQLASRAGSSGPTVLRFAARLGFDGFVELQAAMQEEIADKLRPATQRIRERRTGDIVSQTLVADLENVRATLDAIDANDFAEVAELVSDRRHRVFVVASELSGSSGRLLAQQLDLLRDGVVLIDGPGPSVSRRLVEVAPGDVVLVIDLRRYEQWVLRATQRADERGAIVIAVTDSRLSQLAQLARFVFTVGARGVGPFDSAVGAMSFTHAFSAAMAAKLRRSATTRLDEIEASWSANGDLV